MRLLVLLAILGLPVSAGLAWTFDWTARGPVRTDDGEVSVDHAPSRRWLSPRTLAAALILLGAGVGVGWMTRSTVSATEAGLSEKTIAVIPFQNLSASEENAFFSIGIQDEILTQLQKISALRVISRSSTMRYPPDATRPPIQAIGEELDARWIVEGSVARVGPQIRLNIQLGEAVTGTQVWAEAYDADLTVQGLLAFQGQIARRVAASLEATIQPLEAARIDAIPTESTQAYELYLQGIDHFSRRREEDLRQAIVAFDRAIATDPDYALAYAGKAMVYAVYPFYSDTPVGESLPRGLAAADRALSIDSTTAEAYAARGDLLVHGEYELKDAEAALRRAILLRPSSAQAHSWLAEVLIASGQMEEGIRVGQRSVELDPLSAVMRLNLGRSLLEAGRTESAIATLERAEELDPAFASVLETLGAAYVQAGRYGDAARIYRRFADQVGPAGANMVDFALAMESSTPADAAAALDAIHESSWRLPAYALARAYMQLGDRVKALEWLETGRRTGDPLLPFVLSSVIFSPLREDPAFRELTSRMR